VTDWPVELSGVTESVTTTIGPYGRWNVAALGIHAPGDCAGDHATARTWGRTRTRRNFEARGEGYVQFTPDPVAFVEAACGVREVDDPVLDSADAWARVEVERRDDGEAAGTGWVDWALHPVEAAVERRRPFAPNRGYYAVVEATVAASRLDVPGYEEATLRERIDRFESVLESCGGERERAAWTRFEELVDWRG
jgi:hypothetical protein